MKPRGIYINGKDAAGTPILHHTKQIAPGETAVMSMWLYDGQNYIVRDYTDCAVEPGKGLQFTSEFSKDIKAEPGKSAAL